MTDKEQVKPLAPEAHRIAINNTATATATVPPIESYKKRRSRKCINCCACTTAVFVILGVVILALMLTVFKVKDPEVTLNYVTIKGLEGINPLNPLSNVNLTVVADLSIKNPNVASFKFKNATTSVYYENMLIGEVRTPLGIAKARRTFQMKATIDFILEVEDIVKVPSFLGDLMAGSLPVSSQTSIRGKVEVLKIIKKTAGVRMDCTLRYIVQKEEIQDQKCKKYVSLMRTSNKWKEKYAELRRNLSPNQRWIRASPWKDRERSQSKLDPRWKQIWKRKEDMEQQRRQNTEQEDHTTVYVQGWKARILKKEIWDFFNIVAPVVNVFIPLKRNKNGVFFAFVRFETEQDADKAIQRRNGYF